MRVQKNTRHGTMVFVPHDKWIGGSLLYYGEYAPMETARLISLVDAQSVVLDIGANIGCLTLPLAKKARRVWAFEPQRLPFQLLCANLALNDVENVVARPQAVGAQAGRMNLRQVNWDNPVNSGGTPLQEDAEQGESTDIVAVDNLALARCDLIKVDVEGGEIDVLAGAKATIAACRPVLYLEADRAESAPALIARVKALGYRPLWDVTPLFSKTNFNRNRYNLFAGASSYNLLCLPADRPTPERFARLPEARDGDTHRTIAQP
jgi:FkbM family methyltransferase